jgi:hypothetical protein
VLKIFKVRWRKPGGHDWIGKGGNMDVSASEVIWDFFKLRQSVHDKGGELNQL